MKTIISPLNTYGLRNLKLQAETNLKALRARRTEEWFKYVTEKMNRNKKYNKTFFLGFNILTTEFTELEKYYRTEDTWGTLTYICIKHKYKEEEKVLEAVIQAIERYPGSQLILSHDDLRIITDEYFLDR